MIQNGKGGRGVFWTCAGRNTSALGSDQCLWISAFCSWCALNAAGNCRAGSIGQRLSIDNKMIQRTN